MAADAIRAPNDLGLDCPLSCPNRPGVVSAIREFAGGTHVVIRANAGRGATLVRFDGFLWPNSLMPARRGDYLGLILGRYAPKKKHS